MLLVLIAGGCGNDDAPTFEEAFPEAEIATSTPVPAAPTTAPTVATVDTGPPPTATPEPTPTPVPLPEPVVVSDGVSFEVPAGWIVDDDQADVDARMSTPETIQGLADANMTGVMDLFGVKVRAIADADPIEDGRMFYVTIGTSPVPNIGLLSTVGGRLVGSFGITVNDEQEIATNVGTALRVETDLDGTEYLAWIWIEDGEARILILTTTDPEVERLIITTLAR